MSEILYVSEKELVAFTKDGVHSFYLPAGVPTAVPEEFVAILVVDGARPTTGKAPTLTKLDDARVNAIVEASRKILAENKADLLDPQGLPSAGALDATLGTKTTKAEREAAFVKLEA